MCEFVCVNVSECVCDCECVSVSFLTMTGAHKEPHICIHCQACLKKRLLTFPKQIPQISIFL